MLTDTQAVLRLVLAVILGGLIGFEREAHGRAAGLRTHMLVCLGSALFMLTSMYIFDMYISSTANVDPSRIASNIVTGIGFLGAGAIIRYGASIKGLTTAASIWAVAGVGLAVGTGYYSAALAATALILACLFLFRKIEGKMATKK